MPLVWLGPAREDYLLLYLFMIAITVLLSWFGRGWASSSTSVEQAIATDGGPSFAASMIILALMMGAPLLGPWIERHEVESGLPIEQVLAFVGSSPGCGTSGTCTCGCRACANI